MFSNLDAAICGAIAITELICVLIYVIVSSIQIRKKIISMGRLIPVQVIVLGGTVATGQTYPLNQYQTTQPPPPAGFYPPQQPPPQSGYYYPPSYEQTQNPNLPLNK